MVPIHGMSGHATDSGIPATPKYGTQAALVMIPKAPCPMKQPAIPTHNTEGMTVPIVSSGHEVLPGNTTAEMGDEAAIT
jgi:hypothetical protein